MKVFSKLINFYRSVFGNEILTTAILVLTLAEIAVSQSPLPSIRVVVNSNQDGAIQADDVVTLREAIALVNGTLSIEQLSDREKIQVQSLDNNLSSRIEFNLPSQERAIAIQELLPPLASPSLLIDGTTQPGYDDAKSPVVAITPIINADVLRGFTVVADGVTIRGLSIYGFNASHGATASLPPADIFIAPLSDVFVGTGRRTLSSTPPKDVVIENNWLGIPPDASIPTKTSAFGVSVFNSVGTTIQNNRIAHHDGSGIITSVRGENLQVKNNIITDNGLAGMPDAIRLEGIVNNTEITANLIQFNAGSGLYLFKPQGSVKIRDNTITNNGQQLQRAAIYLMGKGHEVVNNKITDQPGTGVTIAAYPHSQGNRIQNNQFAKLQGLSIDLVSQQNVGVIDYQQGDGVNPVHDSYQRHRQAGNFGIDAPKFLSREFFILQDELVTLDGLAAPDSVVEIYKVSEVNSNIGTLNGAIATVNTDKDGRFSIKLGNLKDGERVSAIAIHPQYGTSEPAYPALIRTHEIQIRS
ncbi:right-handed parallel beta-helix repeat-containing protein [Tolypothrix sp. FACHB-123]|uniref:right-handed parallel beta-helix repeat-containing protein n=1 Tax=Tolypothrix sp. FACHB-123 TaxID=2692868 RepID=UPI0016857D4D|nr:right-handed parallel beta-helix repeat-containing protein [Tolypothrix sp. FACHB-123]MBD2356975.1 right-handed parallel beta-helix repeat-containing protein [Tolypothrix sp. FACHB-123]